MKQNEIQKNGVYMAKINGRVVPVKVLLKSEQEQVRSHWRGGNREGTSRLVEKAKTVYHCRNLVTNREVFIKSAAKFRRTATEADIRIASEPKTPLVEQLSRPVPQTDRSRVENIVKKAHEVIGQVDLEITADRLAREVANLLTTKSRIMETMGLRDSVAERQTPQGRKMIHDHLMKFQRGDIARFFR